MTETMQKLQRQLEEQERKANIAAADAARELAVAKSQAANRIDPEADKRQLETNAKLQKAISLLKAEREKLAQEKERFRQEELERYRREHYPEYYEKKSATDAAIKKSSNTISRPVVQEESELDDDQAIEYFQDDTYTIPVEVKGKRAGWRVPLD